MLTQSERDQLYGKLLTIFTDHDIIYSEYYRNDLAKLAKDHQSIVEENMKLLHVVIAIRNFIEELQEDHPAIDKFRFRQVSDALDKLTEYYEEHPEAECIG